MSTAAIITMVTTQVLVTALTIYFFKKVLGAPKKPEPDSYTENNDK